VKCGLQRPGHTRKVPQTSRSSITLEEGRIRIVTRPPIHPGEILTDELAEIGITPTKLARQLGMPPNRISQIIAGKRAITSNTALRLGHWFGNSAQFWLNLQAAYDLRMAEAAIGKEVEALPVRPAAAGETRTPR
jgi:antitoxin HigA-1